MTCATPSRPPCRKQRHKLRFFIGDVRDLSSIRNAMYGVDYIFHAAALKQVPSCEFFPMEAVRTNVIGTDNVLTAAIEAGVESVICLSTDKAAYPINAMGITKALEEKVAVAKSRTSGKTRICCTRYGATSCVHGAASSRSGSTRSKTASPSPSPSRP